MSEKKFDKFAYFLPNTFTAMNIGCGFMAILFSMQGMFYKACMFIMLGSIFDMVDGRVARLTGTESSFGEQFDSMSDLISFGAAPAIIFYNRFLSDLGRVGMIIAFFYLLCGALRLARFNANITKVKSDYFQGLPIPGAAIAILGYILVSIEYPGFFLNKYIATSYIIFYSVLMITNIPFTSFKNGNFARRHKKKLLFLIFIIISSLFLYEQIMIPILITAYVQGCLIYLVFNRKRFKGIFDWDEEELEENEAPL